LTLGPQPDKTGRMADIHIARGETKLGVFAEEEVQEGLRTGRFGPTDLAWRDGMANWLPLAQMDFGAAGGPPRPDATESPGTTPTAQDIVAVIPNGLPWDRRQELGIFPAFVETLKLVLLNPATSFTAMKTEGGLTEPLIYAVIGGSVGFIVYFLFSLFISSFGLVGTRNALAGVLGVGVGAVVFVIFMPVLIALGVFIGSAILHLCLTLVGGARRPFETTFRVVSFAVGSAYPLMIVPLCGGLISGIWCIVVECIGLTRAHQTTTGRALLAILLPIIVCCGGGLVLAVMGGIFGSLAGHH
jgi:hypothetical protein